MAWMDFLTSARTLKLEVWHCKRAWRGSQCMAGMTQQQKMMETIIPGFRPVPPPPHELLSRRRTKAGIRMALLEVPPYVHFRKISLPQNFSLAQKRASLKNPPLTAKLQLGPPTCAAAVLQSPAPCAAPCH